MSWWLQYKALMWKNFILKIRHPISTASEILLPVVLMLLLILLRSQIKTTDKDTFEDIYHPYTYVLDQTPASLLSNWTNWLTKNPRYKLGISPNHTQFINYLSQNLSLSRDLIHTFSDSDEFSSYIDKSNYGSSDDIPYIAGYIEWLDSDGPKYKYKIWMNVTLGSTDQDTVLTAQCVPTNYYPKLQIYQNWFIIHYPFMWAGYEDVESDYLVKYEEGGFLALQLACDEYLMSKNNQDSGNNNIEFTYPNLNIRPFPTPSYVYDIFAVAMEAFLGLLLTLVFIWPVTRIVKGIVEEKEKRIKEGMKIMGLTEPVLITSWLTLYMIIFFLVALLITLITSINVFTHSNKIIIFLLFYLFSMAIYCFAYLVSVFFTRAKVGSIIGALLLLALLAPGFSITDTSPRSFRTLVSLSPITAFYLTAYNVFTFESDSIGANWDNLTDVFDNYTILLGITMMLLDCIIYFVLAIYLTYVLPATYGVPLPFYFPCMPSFWCPKDKKNKTRNNNNNNNNEDRLYSPRNNNNAYQDIENQPNFEGVSENLEVGVSISHLRKVFATSPETVAVKDLSLNMYNGEIFALLGHNGAGKTTTINMLTGMFPATSGDAMMAGDYISSDMLSIRQKIGYCPQHDILFDDLTIKEHLLFFASIKGMQLTYTNEQIDTIINEMIASVGLEEKTNALSKSLSGGQKRRLSCAIALLGDSEIVFLDEPTSGMDVYYRRHTWELLKKMKQNRVIVLTTHFMDEADQIGDRIAIMSHGEVRCCGSSLYLKSIYGVGYTMTIVKKTNNDNRKNRNNNNNYNNNMIVPSQPIIDLVFRHVQPKSYVEANGLTLENDRKQQGVRQRREQRTSTAADKDSNNNGNVIYTEPSISMSTGPAAVGSASNSMDVFENDDNNNNGISSKDASSVLSDAGGEISFRIPFSASKTFASLFNELDNETICENYGISHYGVSVTTLEEVFLRVGQDEEIDVKEREVIRRKSTMKQLETDDEKKENFEATERETTTTTANNKSPYLNKYPSKTENGKAITVAMKEAGHNSDHELEMLVSNIDMNPNAFQHMYALIIKRFHNIKRDKRVWTCQLLIPFLILMLGIALVKVGLELGEQKPQALNTKDEYNQPLYTAWFAYDNDSFNFDLIDNSVDNIKMVEIHNDTWKANIDRDWLQFSKFLLNSRNDYKQSQYGAFYVKNGTKSTVNTNKTIIGNSDVTLFINTTSRDAIPVFINILNRQYLRQLSSRNDKNNISIDATYVPYPLTASQAAQYDSIAGIWIALGLGFIPPTFAAYVVMERSVNIKHLQVISGINLVSYWLANWIFDSLNFFITSLFTLIVIQLYNVSALIGENMIATFVMLLCFAFAAPPYTYCWSFLFNNANSAQNFILLLFFITGCVLAIVVGVLSLYTSTYPSNLDYVWRLMPNYAFLDALDKLLIRNAAIYEGFEELGIFDWDMTMQNIVYLLCEGVGYFLLTLMIEFTLQTPWIMQYFETFRLKRQASIDNILMHANINNERDIDVLNEQERVANGDSERNGDIIILKNLSKVYPGSGKQGPKLAVNDVSFGITNGECFGFLGNNGAGKTSTLKMLSGDILPSMGTALMNNYDLLENAHNIRQHIGYCPQFDALLPLLTGKELLYLFARIKGISENLIEKFVSQLIDKIGLNEYYDKPSGGYSGGNKRKLSVGMALIGNPSIVFLDEPSTGIDPGSRRFMWNLISNTMHGRSVILTTHSMEEAEALCMRIGIMVNGQLSCLGSAQHLRSRFGKGFQIDVNFDVKSINEKQNNRPQRGGRGGDSKNDSRIMAKERINVMASKFEEWISSRFENWEKLEEQNSHFKYKVDKSLSLGKIFNEIEMNKDKLYIKEYSVAQTSLEQIFMYFARNQLHHENVPFYQPKLNDIGNENKMANENRNKNRNRNKNDNRMENDYQPL